MRPSQAAASEAVTLTATNRAPYAYVYEWFTATIAKGDRVSQRPAVVCVCACVCVRVRAFCDTSYQTWGESTFNDSESDSGRLFDSESESDSSQFGYDSESNSDSSNISISDSESDSNFQLLIWNYC